MSKILKGCNRSSEQFVLFFSDGTTTFTFPLLEKWTRIFESFEQWANKSKEFLITQEILGEYNYYITFEWISLEYPNAFSIDNDPSVKVKQESKPSI